MAFDVDQASLARLQKLLPDWQIAVVNGATAASLPGNWNPAAADLQIVGLRAEMTETLALCRSLAQSSWHQSGTDPPPHAPLEPSSRRAPARLIVLIPREQRAVVGAVYAAGAYRCLMLPLREYALADMVVRVRAERRKERAAQLERERTHDEGRWYDEGGQGYDYAASVWPSGPARGDDVPSLPGR